MANDLTGLHRTTFMLVTDRPNLYGRNGLLQRRNRNLSSARV